MTKQVESVSLEKPGAATRPEKEITPEHLAERRLEAVPENIEVAETLESANVTAPVAPTLPLTAQQIREAQIDQILSEGLEEAFLSLPPQQQMKFKTEGEATVKKIGGLLSKTKIQIKKIISLIKNWLSFIPGFNKFFLEQEAKFKADKIVALKHRGPNQS